MNTAAVKVTAETSADTLRGVVRSALEAAGWTVTQSDNWSKTLWVQRTQGDTIGDSVADIVITVGKKNYYTVVEATVNARWRELRKVTYWVGQNDGFTFPAEKVAKIVARVKDIAKAIDDKKEAEVRYKAHREQAQAEKAAWLKPVEDFMEAHGIGSGYESKHKVKEVGVGTLKLEGLTAEQMVAILAVIQ